MEQELKEDSKKSKVLMVLLVILLLLVLGVVLLYSSIISKLREGTVETISKEEMTQESLLSERVPIIEQEQIDANVINVLLLGSDSRNVNVESGRSDTIMLVSYNHFLKKATMVSFLRDTFVDIPGYGWTKLGHSYAYGGAGLTINTINETYDLDVQNYITINFDNLENIIDKIGGIDVPITAQEAYLYQQYGKTYIHEGLNHLNGEDALMHARNREIDNDFGRTRRQRSVLNAIYQKILSEKNPADILKLVEYCLSQVKTNMDMKTIYDMALKVLGSDDLLIQQMSLPADGLYKSTYYNGMSVLEIDLEANKERLENFLY